MPTGTELVRIHWRDKGAVFFGPSPGVPPGNRFDAPKGEYRTLYAAEAFPGAFVETVLRRPDQILRRTHTEQRAVSVLITQRPLQLAKLFDEGLQWHGIDASNISIEDYAFSRELARDLHATFPALDGLAYRSRYNNGQICYAIFDRVTQADISPRPKVDLPDIQNLVDDVMRLHGAEYDDSPAP